MIEKISLTEISINDLDIYKETNRWYGELDHSRWVFMCRNMNLIDNCTELFIKLWNPTYIRRDNILLAIDSGFYDKETVPVLKALIFHKGLCRGYIMDKCKKNLGLRLSDEFFHAIKDKSKKTALFNAQFSPCHVMKYKKGFSLIDLEGVFHISDLADIHRQMAFFDYEGYKNFIFSEYNRTNHDLNRVFSADKMKNHCYFKNINPILRTLQSVKKGILPAERISSCKNTTYIEF